MADENVGLDLASQTGQEDIVEAINGLTSLLSRSSNILTLGKKTATQNGVFDPSDDGVDGYDEFIVNLQMYTNDDFEGTPVYKPAYSGFLTPPEGYAGFGNLLIDQSSSGIQLMTRATWDTLSTAEKQSLGLVAIQDSSSGYKRGVLINGADYIPLGYYIPNSDETKVICEAYSENYEASSNIWGVGNSPIQLTGAPTIRNDGAIGLNGYTNNIYGYVDLGSNDTPFTAYIVAKTIGGTNYRRILSAFNSRNSGQGIMLYGATINVSSWANDTPLGIVSTDYFVGVIRYESSGNASGGAINESNTTLTLVSKQPTTAGRYVTIGRNDIDSSTVNAEPTDIDVLYCAVVSEAESDNTVTANIANLLNEFIVNQQSNS